MNKVSKVIAEELEVATNSPADVLKALLSAEQSVQKVVPMKRFGVDFTIQALDGAVIDRIQEQCTIYVGKGSKRTKKVDEQKFGALIIQKGCVVPNWTDKALLDHYQTHDAVDVIKRRLLAGEIAKLSAEIMEISGFDDEDEAIDEVKN